MRCVCTMYNMQKAFSAPIVHILPPDGLFRHLMIDYVDVTQQTGRMRNILVVVCRFSRWIEATPSPRPDIRSVAKFLCKEVFPKFGLPDTSSSDNGPHFVAEVIKTTTKVLKIKQKFVCVYHPQSKEMLL